MDVGKRCFPQLHEHAALFIVRVVAYIIMHKGSQLFIEGIAVGARLKLVGKAKSELLTRQLTTAAKPRQ